MKSEIHLQVNGQVAKAYLAGPKSGGPGVLVLHAWWGLKPFFKWVCNRLAEQGFTALAPDLYQGRVARTIEEASALMEQRDAELMGDTIKAAKDYLVSLRPGKRIGVLGFSMGASWALATAANEPDVSAIVLFYGTEGMDFNQVRANVLGHYAEIDEWEPLAGVRAMEAKMKATGLSTTIHIYPKVGHWFVEEDRPEYNEPSASLAWERTFEFLKKNLK
jgi:carboxymethylenebutenolidase